MRNILQHWRSWALCALGALILWVGFSEIVGADEGGHLDMLGPITVMAAIGFPYALSRWFPRRQ